VTGDRKGAVKVWGLATLQEVAALAGHTDEVRGRAMGRPPLPEVGVALRGALERRSLCSQSSASLFWDGGCLQTRVQSAHLRRCRQAGATRSRQRATHQPWGAGAKEAMQSFRHDEQR